MAAIIEHGTSIKLNPTPGFVVKTKIVEGNGDHIYHTKVFINICHDGKVPKPERNFDPAVVFPLIVDNQWEIPLIVSPEKKDSDKKGVPLFVYDCCMNSECFSWIQINNDLKLIAVEWCIEAVELMHELVLEREYTVPKMLSKGELSATEVSREELSNGLQKRLQVLKQNEHLGLLEALEPESDVIDEELPDLMNIGGTKTKPLIEEISDMSIDDLESEKSRKKTLITEIKSDSGKSGNYEVSKNQDENPINSSNRPVTYEFVITPCTRDKNFYIKFESHQLNLQLDISFVDLQIRITNTDSARQLTKENRLDLPIPANAVPYQSFIVEKEKSLYVFCHLS